MRTYGLLFLLLTFVIVSSGCKKNFSYNQDGMPEFIQKVLPLPNEVVYVESNERVHISILPIVSGNPYFEQENVAPSADLLQSITEVVVDGKAIDPDDSTIVTMGSYLYIVNYYISLDPGPHEVVYSIDVNEENQYSFSWRFEVLVRNP